MFKLLIFSLLVLYCSASPVSDAIEKAIQQIRDTLPEPIHIPELNIAIPDNEYISGSSNLSDLGITGLKAFELKVNYGWFGEPKSFSFELRHLQIETKYLMNIPLFHVKILTLFGLGTTRLTLSDLSVNGSINILSLPKLFSSLKISLSEAEFEVTGFLNDTDYSKELSVDLTKSIASTINNNAESLASLIENVLNDVLGSIMPKKSTTLAVSDKINYEDEEFQNILLVLLDDIKVAVEDFLRTYYVPKDISDPDITVSEKELSVA